MKNIVCIGGGTGISAVLAALKDRAHVTAIISMADDGGSAGVLRKQQVFSSDRVRLRTDSFEPLPTLVRISLDTVSHPAILDSNALPRLHCSLAKTTLGPFFHRIPTTIMKKQRV